MKKELVCVNCPMGCRISVEMKEGKIVDISGNTCPKGKEYAEQECIRPMRILTTTVRICHGVHRVLPVISERSIPLDLVFQAMEQVKHVEVSAPVKEGDVILDDLAGTGVKLLASRSMEKVDR